MTDNHEDYHLGRRTLEVLKKYENDIHQIEITNGDKETHGSVRIRTIRMAQSLKSRGFKKGDVIMISAVNHNDMSIPYIASLYLGTIPLGVATDMKHLEIIHVLTMAKPNLIFAEPDIAPALRKAVIELGLKTDIVTFGSEKIDGYLNLSEFIQPTGSEESFECDDFDTKTTIGLLACSSGTTGQPKLVALSHYALYITLYLPRKNIPEQMRKAGSFLCFSSIYWISGSVSILSSCLSGFTRLHSIKPFSPEDFQKIATTYKPSGTLLSQVALSSIMKYAEQNEVDFSNYRLIYFGGSTVSEDLIDGFRKLVPNAEISTAYGATEVMFVTGGPHVKRNSCGKVNSYIEKWKIVDIDSGKELGPNQPGELRLKSPNMFLGYYNNPESTSAAFDEEGFYKTGDLMYYDEEGYFYVLDRIKQLIKYRNFQVGCSEVEDIIGNVPGVLYSGIVGVPHPEDGEHPMAFVERVPGSEVTAKQIIDCVKEKLSDAKQLRAGVVFLDKMPMTYSGKIDRKALNKLKTTKIVPDQNSIMNKVINDDDSHLGRFILKVLKKYKDDIQQIEITTGASETHGSIRMRTIRMAQALKAKGMKKGDVIMISAVNHNDICIPYIASMYIGTIPLPVTTDMKHLEIKHIASMGRPKMVFADPDVGPIIKKVMSEMGSDVEIVIFGNEKVEGYTLFSELVEPTGNEDDFECEDFDPAKTICTLTCSSGTTGLPKLVALSHTSLYLSFYVPRKNMSDAERKGSIFIGFSPLYWISGSSSIIMSCLLGNMRLHSIKPFSPEIFQKAAKIYKPTFMMISQVALSSLLNYAETNDVDFSSFRMIFHGGSATNADLIDELQKRVVNGVVTGAYGCTEVLNITGCLIPKRESCGQINPTIQWKIIDIETERELGPNKPGEMRVKSSNMFLEYYNCPEATIAAFDSNGWYKTGDLMYYDDEGYYYVVDRIKELIKYRNYQIGTIELENVICNIPGVMVAGVVGIPHPEDGEHPMAFIQLAPGVQVSAQEIKDYIKDNMSDSKQLRGGVVFLDKIPTTYSGKVDRKCLKMMKNKYRGE